MFLKAPHTTAMLCFLNTSSVLKKHTLAIVGKLVRNADWPVANHHACRFAFFFKKDSVLKRHNADMVRGGLNGI